MGSESSKQALTKTELELVLARERVAAAKLSREISVQQAKLAPAEPTLTKADLELALERERVLTAAKLRQELTIQQAIVAREPTLTKADLELALERERVLTAAKLKQELSVQQGTSYGTPSAFAPGSAPAPPTNVLAQTRSPVNIYPELNAYSNHMQPLANMALQQTNSPFAPHVRTVPSAPVFDNVLPKERNGQPNAHTISSAPVFVNNKLPNGRNAQLNAQSNQNIAKCPTCKIFYGIYIYNCLNGHSACQNCRICGICRSSITTNRNFTLEKEIAEYFKKNPVSCPNKDRGCSLSMDLTELDAHKKVCTFKEIMCPLGPILGICYWKGTLSSMSAHFNSDHPENCGAVNNEITIGNLSSHSHKVYFVTLGRYNFLVHIGTLLDDQKICMTVQLYGTQHDASKWDYEFHVYKKSEKRIKYTYTDVCYPHNTEIAQIFSSNKCAVLPSVYYINFVNSGGIACKFYIKKRFESIESNQKETSNETEERNNRRNRKYGRNKNRIPS